MELLVVIAILASLLLPALTKANGHAQSVACSNNLRQLQLGWLMASRCARRGDIAAHPREALQLPSRWCWAWPSAPGKAVRATRAEREQSMERTRAAAALAELQIQKAEELFRAGNFRGAWVCSARPWMDCR